MNFLDAIEIFSIPLFESGFELAKCDDKGMFKSCLLNSPEFGINFLFEKGPIHCDLVKGIEKPMDLIHLVNFINLTNNSNKSKYAFPGYAFDASKLESSNDLYVQYYVEIIVANLQALADFIRNMQEKDVTEFNEYCKSENLKQWEQKG